MRLITRGSRRVMRLRRPHVRCDRMHIHAPRESAGEKQTRERILMNMKRKAVVIDDHPALRIAVRMLLERDGQFEVVGEAADAVAGWRAISNASPDLVVLDLDLPGSGLPLIERATRQHPRSAVLVMSALAESLYAPRAAAHGAKGFVSKDSDTHTISLAIASVAAGYSFFPGLAARGRPVSTPQEVASCLTDREISVMHFLVKGLAHKEIARQLNISIKTVSTYKIRLLRKLGLSSLAALVEFTCGTRLMDGDEDAPAPRHAAAHARSPQDLVRLRVVTH